jgi:hypothetical protein
MVTYHEYRAAAYPRVDADTGEPLVRAPHIPPQDVLELKLGVSDYCDLFDTLPPYMYSAERLMNFIPPRDDVVHNQEAIEIVEDADEAWEQGQVCMDALAREAPIDSFTLLGETAITSFLRAYAESVEAGEKKWMPWREADYLLPRVESDLQALITGGFIAGVSTAELIPEEHRYRALLSMAYTMAKFYTSSRRSLDIPRQPLSDFRDQRHQRISVELAHPMHAVYGMLHRLQKDYGRSYNPSLAHFLGAYGIDTEEFTEVVQHVWAMRTYWFEAASSARSVNDHFDRPPNPDNAQIFIEQTDAESLRYYFDAIRATVRAGLNPYDALQDLPGAEDPDQMM